MSVRPQSRHNYKPCNEVACVDANACVARSSAVAGHAYSAAVATYHSEPRVYIVFRASVGPHADHYRCVAALSLCGHYAVDAGRVDMDRAIIRGVARERDGGGVA